MLENWPAELPNNLVNRLDCAISCMTPGEYLTHREAELQELAVEIYQERLALGVAREQARKDLPLPKYTETQWQCELDNFLNTVKPHLAFSTISAKLRS